MVGPAPLAQSVFWREHWGDVASLIGLVVGIIGFARREVTQ